MIKKALLTLILGATLMAGTAGSASAAPYHQDYGHWMGAHPGIAADLHRHPEWIRDRHYLYAHPELQGFIAANPGFAVSYASPGFSVGYANPGFSVGVNLPVYAPSYGYVGWYRGRYWDHNRYRDGRGWHNYERRGWRR